jgi:hypothetical protein
MEERALTRVLWRKTFSIEWPGLAGRLREGEDSPGAVTVIIRQMFGDFSFETILKRLLRHDREKVAPTNTPVVLD